MGLNKPQARTFQPLHRAPIRAELSGDDTCTALGITASSVIGLCRKLILHGFDPALPCHAYRGDVLCLRVRAIGEAARLRVAPHGAGFQCLLACTGASPVGFKAIAGGAGGPSPERALPASLVPGVFFGG